MFSDPWHKPRSLLNRNNAEGVIPIELYTFNRRTNDPRLELPPFGSEALELIVVVLQRRKPHRKRILLKEPQRESSSLLSMYQCRADMNVNPVGRFPITRDDDITSDCPTIDTDEAHELFSVSCKHKPFLALLKNIDLNTRRRAVHAV